MDGTMKFGKNYPLLTFELNKISIFSKYRIFFYTYELKSIYKLNNQTQPKISTHLSNKSSSYFPL